MAATQIADTLTAQLDHLIAFARTRLTDTGASEKDCQLVAILNRAGELQAAINGISEGDIKEQEPEPRIVTDLLVCANAAYCDWDDLRIHEDLPHGVRGDGLADFIATEIREVMMGENSTRPAVEAIQRAAEQLQHVANELSEHIPY